MSLLNDALRKRDKELDQQKKAVPPLNGSPPLETNRIKICGLLISTVLIVGILTVLCYKRYFHEGFTSVQPQVAVSASLQGGVPPNRIDPSPDSPKASLSTPGEEGHGTLSDGKENDYPVVTKQSKKKKGDKGPVIPPGSKATQGPKSSLSSVRNEAQESSLSGGDDGKSMIPEKSTRPQKRKAELRTLGPDKEATEKTVPPKQIRRSGVPKIVKGRQGESRQKPAQRHLPDGSESPFYRKALSYHRLGQRQMAIDMYLDVLKRNPGHHDAAFNLASAYIETSHFSKARRCLERLEELDPDNPQVALNLALAEIGLGRSQNALDHLEEAERLGGPMFEIYIHRGIAFSQIGRLDEAMAWYKRAEEISRNKPLLLFNMAVCNDKSQKYKEALRYYLAFVKQNPSAPDRLQEIQRRIATLKAYLSRQANEVGDELHGLTGR